MKLSVEAKVATAVAAGFIALAAAAIGQGGSENQGGGPNNYGVTDNSVANMQISDEGHSNSLPSSTFAEHNRQTVAGHAMDKLKKAHR